MYRQAFSQETLVYHSHRSSPLRHSSHGNLELSKNEYPKHAYDKCGLVNQLIWYTKFKGVTEALSIRRILIMFPPYNTTIWRLILPISQLMHWCWVSGTASATPNTALCCCLSSPVSAVSPYFALRHLLLVFYAFETFPAHRNRAVKTSCICFWVAVSDTMMFVAVWLVIGNQRLLKNYHSAVWTARDPLSDWGFF